MLPELKEVVADAYREFGRYSLGPPLIACHCSVCMTPETAEALAATPLRELRSDTLAEYTNSAHGWDDGIIERQMRYLLPRYLELIASGDPPDQIGLSACLRRIADAHWRQTWPAVEVSVLDRYFDAFAADSLRNLELWEWPVGWRLGFDFSKVLTLVVTSGGDLGRVLDRWDREADPPAVLHMAALRSDVIEEHDRAYLHDAFLDRFPEEANRIGAFLLRPEVDSRIETAALAIDDERLQAILIDALR